MQKEQINILWLKSRLLEKLNLPFSIYNTMEIEVARPITVWVAEERDMKFFNNQMAYINLGFIEEEVKEKIVIKITKKCE